MTHMTQPVRVLIVDDDARPHRAHHDAQRVRRSRDRRRGRRRHRGHGRGQPAPAGLRTGASGFLFKHTPPAQIAHAIRQVADGEPMLSPEVIRRVMSFAAEPDPEPQQARANELLGRLSDGERAVATLVGQGRTNSEIGRDLLMSTATVKAYMSRILTKLDLNNRVQVALLVHDARAERSGQDSPAGLS